MNPRGIERKNNSKTAEIGLRILRSSNKYFEVDIGKSNEPLRFCALEILSRHSGCKQFGIMYL